MSSDTSLRSEAIAILTEFGLEHLLDRNPKKLSGGEKRIISILRGILSDASLILIDEPTNDLDNLMVEKVIDIISEYLDKKSFLIVTHDERLDGIAKNIFILKDCIIYLAESYRSIEENYSSKKYVDIDREPSRSCDLALISKIFKRKYFSIVLMTLLLILSMFTINNVKITETNKIQSIHPGQVDIFIPLSQTGMRLMTRRTNRDY